MTSSKTSAAMLIMFFASLAGSWSLAGLGPEGVPVGEGVFLPITAHYLQPSQKREIQSHELKEATLEIAETSQIYFDYVVPEDLIGRVGEHMFMFTREPASPDQPFELFCRRTRTVANCIPHRDEIKCEVTFRNLTIVPAEVESLLNTKYANDPQLNDRVLAARAFDRDPIGKITIKFKVP